MMKRIIPFRYLPAAWGLRGPAYDEAEAAYYFEGEALERRLAEIRFRDDPVGLVKKNIQLDFVHGHTTEHQRDRALVELEYADGMERDLALLKVDHQHQKIDVNEYEKRCADLKREPWVGIKDSGYDAREGVGGMYFEFDWNDAWIELLRRHGYVGNSDEQVFEQWFADLSRSVIEEAPDLGSAPLHRRGVTTPYLVR